MSVNVAQVLERVRQIRTSGAHDLPGVTRDDAARYGTRRGTFVAGDRAFDTVSGQHVEVISAGSENVVIPAPERRNG